VTSLTAALAALLHMFRLDTDLATLCHDGSLCGFVPEGSQINGPNRDSGLEPPHGLRDAGVSISTNFFIQDTSKPFLLSSTFLIYFK